MVFTLIVLAINVLVLNVDFTVKNNVDIDDVFKLDVLKVLTLPVLALI
jgi:hypothetical protein